MYAIQYCDTMEKARVSVKDRNIISKIDMKSSKGFPKSKKIYIKVFDLGFFMAELDKTGKKLNVAEDFSITDAEWTFEIDVPDKFYERQIEELELKEPIQGVKIEKMYVTEVGLVLEIKIDGIDDIIMAGKDMSIEEWKKIRMETINITDGEGNIYYEKSMGTLNEKDSIKINYEINKNMLNKKLFLNVKIDGKQYRGELIKK